MIVRIISYSIIIFLSACATMTNGTHQKVTVATTNNQFYESTRCTLNNEEGSWSVNPDEISEIHRDGNTMNVACKNEAQNGEALVNSDFQQSNIFFNILLDYCTITCLIDAATNAFFEYPALITVPMKSTEVSNK